MLILAPGGSKGNNPERQGGKKPFRGEASQTEGQGLDGPGDRGKWRHKRGQSREDSQILRLVR